MPTTNIDDLLIAEEQRLKDPAPAEPKEDVVSRETIKPVEVPEEKTEEPKETKAEDTNEYGDISKDDEEEAPEADDYGLETEKGKTYTQAEMDAYANKLIRERLARFERNSGQPQPTQQQVQQQAKQAQQGFEYDENSNLDWQQQLKEFIKQTNYEVAQEHAEQIKQAKEQQAQAELEMKFREGMGKFKDFGSVVGGKNITDAMVMAARNMKDPAAFFYAAAKRAPEELATIAQYDDPYAQAAAIGRLDERLRKQAQASKAPRPVSRTQSDATVTHGDVGQPSIEDLIAQEDARKLAMGRRR